MSTVSKCVLIILWITSFSEPNLYANNRLTKPIYSKTQCGILITQLATTIYRNELCWGWNLCWPSWLPGPRQFWQPLLQWLPPSLSLSRLSSVPPLQTVCARESERKRERERGKIPLAVTSMIYNIIITMFTSLPITCPFFATSVSDASLYAWNMYVDCCKALQYELMVQGLA